MKVLKDIKKDFPIFKQRVNSQPLVYLDSAATSQKPKQVLDAIVDYYKNYNANVRRGIYPIAEKATEKVEEVRSKISKLINARSPQEIIFVRNTTEALNLVAYAFASHNIKKGDTIVSTIMEHHSNFVPWQQICLKKGAQFEVFDIDNQGQLVIDYKKIKNAKLLALAQVSNVLGTINPVKDIIKKVRRINKKLAVIVDAAQSVPHMKIDVQKMDCDFLGFSMHKALGATGIGVLYGKQEYLKKMKPFLFGGEMIEKVTIKKTNFANPPFRFEAGTPDIAGIVSIGAAIDYLSEIGMKGIRDHDKQLLAYALDELSKIEGLTIYGPKDTNLRSGVIAFNLKGVHPHDIAQILGEMGICIRAGHHCTMPLHKRLGISASARASFYIYNDKQDVDALVRGIKKVKDIFKQ